MNADSVVSSISKFAHSHYQKGFEQGRNDALKGLTSRCRNNRCKNPTLYDNGYIRGYRKGAKETGKFDLLVDSPARGVGSDFNGDGIHDVIVGAYTNDDGGSAAGAAYIYFGSASLSGTKIAGGSTDVTILGKAASDLLGRRVSSAGDVNEDGFDDVIVGANGNDDKGNGAGAAYIFFGGVNLSGTKTAGTDTNVTILGRIASDNLGQSVGGGKK